MQLRLMGNALLIQTWNANNQSPDLLAFVRSSPVRAKAWKSMESTNQGEGGWEKIFILPNNAEMEIIAENEVNAEYCQKQRLQAENLYNCVTMKKVCIHKE